MPNAPAPKVPSRVCTALATCLLSALLLAVSSGCESPQSVPGATGDLITYSQAQELGYQVAWHSAFARTASGRLDRMVAFDDMVVGLETGHNVVSALTARDGSILWDVPVGEPLERIVGIVRYDDQVLVSTQSDLYGLDTATGRINLHQRFGEGNVSGTPPLIVEPYAIYGSPDGRVVYHHLGAGLMEQAYRLDSAVVQQPKWIVGAYVAVTQSGRVYAIDPSTNERFWDSAGLGVIEAEIAVGPDAVYAASVDQSVWAYRRSDGRLKWRFRTQRPLRDDPVYLDGVVYQVAATQGLIAIDGETGEHLWTAEGIESGHVLTRQDGNLIVFSPGRQSSTLYAVDQRNGDVVARVESPWIIRATASSQEGGDVYAMTLAGRVVKLTP